jgi:hypothetical protein
MASSATSRMSLIVMIASLDGAVRARDSRRFPVKNARCCAINAGQERIGKSKHKFHIFPFVALVILRALGLSILLLAMDSIEVGEKDHLSYAVEGTRYKGPWSDIDEKLRKAVVWSKYVHEDVRRRVLCPALAKPL